MKIDLTTRYLGLTLKNPLAVSANPLTGEEATLIRLEKAGASAVVLPSLFEEQIEHDQIAVHEMQEFHADSFAESLDYFPELDDYNTGPGTYLEQVQAAKACCSIPVIGSLNGATVGGWTRYARMIQDAGADALELNIYLIPSKVNLSGQHVEDRYTALVASVRETISIPMAVKIGPYFSSIPGIARRLVDAGADGLVLFNRYLEPDIDLETLEVVPRLVLSSRDELRLSLRWIAILRGRIDTSLAATSGVHQVEDVVKAILAGADVTMMASALLKYGPEHIATLLKGLESWLSEHEYDSIEQMKGSVSQANCGDPAAYERSNYMKALISYSGKLI